MKEQSNNNFVLSIDPALSTTGYAIINFDTEELVCVNKFITTNKIPQDERIEAIITELLCVAEKHSIKYIVIEDGFSGVNSKTSLQLAQLRGGIIAVFRINKYNIEHMLPSIIRKHFGCGGNAKKEQVAEKVTELYKYNEAFKLIGPYSDKQNKSKTSDMYDAISIGVGFIRYIKESMKDDGTANE